MGTCNVFVLLSYLSHYSLQLTYQMSILYLINHKDVLFDTSQSSAIILIVQGKINVKNKGLVINHVKGGGGARKR